MGVLLIRVPDSIGGLKRDPNLENYPHGAVHVNGASTGRLRSLHGFLLSYVGYTNER